MWTGRCQLRAGSRVLRGGGAGLLPGLCCKVPGAEDDRPDCLLGSYGSEPQRAEGGPCRCQHCESGPGVQCLLFMIGSAASITAQDYIWEGGSRNFTSLPGNFNPLKLPF